MAASGVAFERGEGSMSKLAASEVAVKATERAIQTMGGWGYINDHPVEKWYRDAKLYTIFEGTSEIQRMVISNALGATVGTPPLHVDIEPSGGPLNKMFGRGTPLRSRVADAALVGEGPGPRSDHASRHENAPPTSVKPRGSVARERRKTHDYRQDRRGNDGQRPRTASTRLPLTAKTSVSPISPIAAISGFSTTP